MPLPDFRVRSTSRFASISSISSSRVKKAIRSATLESTSSSRSNYLHRSHTSKTSTVSQENRRVVRQAMVCAGSLLRLRCKVLWKPVALQLLVTITSSLSEDESHFDDCEDDSDDSGEENDIDTLTTMARPNKSRQYSLVFCYRSLLGHIRRERIELDNSRDPVEFIWGEDGLLSTRFEFSIVYGRVGSSGRRRTLACRARDAKEYLQWTEALRTVMEDRGKNKGGMKCNRSTHAHTLSSSKAFSNSRGSIASFFDADVVAEQQQLFKQEAAWKASMNAPTSPTAATAAVAIAPPQAEIAEESALKPVPADIAAEYGVNRRQEVSFKVNPPHPISTKLQRRTPLTSSSGMLRPNDSVTSKPTASQSQVVNHPVVTVSRPVPTGQRCRRAARYLNLDSPISQRGEWTPDNKITSKRSRLCVSPSYESEEKRPNSPLALAPVLGALPMLQSPSSLEDSPFDFIDNLHTTQLANSFGLSLMTRKSEEIEDAWLISRRSSSLLDVDMCDIEEVKSLNRRTRGESWSAYLKAMECEL